MSWKSETNNKIIDDISNGNIIIFWKLVKQQKAGAIWSSSDASSLQNVIANNKTIIPNESDMIRITKNPLLIIFFKIITIIKSIIDKTKDVILSINKILV